MNFTRFARRGYLQGATPIEPMTKLSRALGGKVNLYVKRVMTCSRVLLIQSSPAV